MQNGFAGFPAALYGTGPPGGQDAFQVRPGGGHHKVPGQVREGPGHLGGVFLPAGFPGDNHGPGIHLFPGDARPGVFGEHQLPQLFAVDAVLGQKGGKVDRAFIEHGSAGNHQVRHGEFRGPVFDLQPGDDHLGGGGAHVQPHA